MTDDAPTAKPLTADASAVEAASAPANDETKPPNNEQEPPAKESRPNQWMAVIAAFIAAVIAAAAAITSAIVSAHTSDSTMRSQSHASAVLAARQEKREAYANYLNSLYDLDVVETDAISIISHYNPEDLPALNAKIGQFNDKFDNWTHLDGVALLIGSTDVQTNRSKLIDVHNAISYLLFTVQQAANENAFNTVVPQIADLKNKENEADNLQSEFGRVAKNDLDNLGYGEH
jgi:hypothetical protein